jgi:hypothetical protein
MSNVRYPEIKVKLVGRDGNAFAILGSMQRELRKAKVSETEIKEFLNEAMGGDYNHLLSTCCEWVTVK